MAYTPGDPYATVADAEELYGSDAIAVVCDRDGDGALDTSSFERHLKSATKQMNGYLLGRYPLPLAWLPEHFVKMCIDIAIADAANRAPTLTTEMKDQRAAALAYMLLVAQNKVKLELSPDTTGPNASMAPQTVTRRAQRAFVEPGARQFTRKNTGRLFE